VAAAAATGAATGADTGADTGAVVGTGTAAVTATATATATANYANISSKGIGSCIVQSLAQIEPDSTYILAVRSVSAGEEAIKELRKSGIQSNLEVLELDVTKDDQIKSAVETVKQKYGRLDGKSDQASPLLIHVMLKPKPVLINNAGWAARINDLSNFRETYAKILDINVISVQLLVESFLPLLKASSDPRVINVSSSRGSVTRSLSGIYPLPLIPYSASKSALNLTTVELQRTYPDIRFHAACPGHCKTGFNNFNGPKDPMDGAKVVVKLVASPRDTYASGFWEYEDGIRTVPF
jgi:NAD(P)-dependent dehydrogenase (short-subunit alcohol dehydrogenase family)